MSQRRGLTDAQILASLRNISESDSDEEDKSEDSEFEYFPLESEGQVQKNDRNSTQTESEEEPSDESEAGPSSSASVSTATISNQRGRGRGQGRGTRGRNYVEPVAGEVFVAPDSTQWEVIDSGSCSTGRLARQNILREPAGPTPFAKRDIKENSFASAWRLLIDEPILRHIKKCMETEAHRQLGDDTWTISLQELDSFLALLYARGAYIARNLPLDHLWSKTWGPPFFHETMPRARFKEIMRFLRFDIKTTRSQRLKTDKFALVSEVWNRFIANSILCFKPGQNVTVDEQLFPTKARCPFTQYMANKPDKFGIKFWLAADSKTKYLVNGFPYLGKDDQRPTTETLSENVVLRLLEPYTNKGRNVTTDNFFTSLKLAEKLKAKNTSIVGTMNRKRREIPAKAKDGGANLHHTFVMKHDDITLTVYQGKKQKNVILLSSLHPDVEVGTDRKKLPETVAFYNNTKCGVDTLDQMARMYSTKAGSRRWPVQVFYNVLDLAAINAWILYQSVIGKKISRHRFMLELAEELRTKPNPRTDARLVPDAQPGPETAMVPRGCKRSKCQVGNPCKGNKTSEKCTQCQKFVCGKCTARVDKKIYCNHCK